MENTQRSGAETAASTELARLETLGDSVWFDAERIQNPLWLRAAILLVGTALMGGWGVLLVRTDSSFPVMLLGIAGSALFVFVVDRLERRHSSARTTTLFPPRRVLRKLFVPTLARLWPGAIASGVLFPRAVDWGVSGWVFALGFLLTMVAIVINAAIIGRLGLWSFPDAQ